MRKIDKEHWNRREHFEFFSKMASPYFGIVSEVDCTKAYEYSKDNGHSFFAYYLFKSMNAINRVEELKLRIVDQDVILFDRIHAGTTIGRLDGTFGFAFVNFSERFSDFNKELQTEIVGVNSCSGLRLNNDDIKKDLIRHSTFPWHKFTALLHPTNFDKSESVPKITFGKFFIQNERKLLPISIEAHHGLVDGLHLANYLNEFQRELDSPE